MLTPTIRSILLVAGFAAAALPVSTQAQGKGPKNKSPHALPPGQSNTPSVRPIAISSAIITGNTVIVITPTPPRSSPAIVIGKPLPVGVVRVPVAQEVLVLVPPPRPATNAHVIGNRIVMIDDRGLVADILDSIF